MKTIHEMESCSHLIFYYYQELFNSLPLKDSILPDGHHLLIIFLIHEKDREKLTLIKH